MTQPVETLQEKLGYRFRQPTLLTRALMHRSRSSELPGVPGNEDNEQFEFLGDSVLGFVVSEALVQQYPSAREGQLSQLKAHLVSSAHLHGCALALGLGDYLLLGKGEERNGGRERKTLLADALEAIIAAIHLDSGIEAARRFVHDRILSALGEPGKVESVGLLNYKSVLQERTQALGFAVPKYATVSTSGPEHAKVFTVEASVGNHSSRASGTSKKTASQEAARLLIEQLNNTQPGQG